MSEIIMGVDIGYGNTKGSKTLIQSGVKKLASKPPIDTKTVEYNGEYYAVGGSKLDIQKSKTENENTLILTMATIAEELKRIGKTSADIRLGVGLPLTRMGAEKQDYLDYMLRSRRLNFKYEGKGYGDFKKDLVEVVVEALAPIKERYEEIRHSDELIEILKDGAVRADAIAQKTMKRVKENFGLGIE